MTRNSFKRKVIIFGVMIFASIALISTGFAAWIISTNAKQETSGNIEVGVVSDKNIKISDISFVGDKKFVFEPSQTKTEVGTMENDKVYVFRADDQPEPVLVVKFKATVTNYKAIDSLTVKLQLPTGIKAAGTTPNEYLVLPVCSADSGVKLYNNGNKVDSSESTDVYTITENPGENTAVIEYTIEFKWGEAFDEKNPSDYYNGMTKEQQATAGDIAATMKTFRDTMAGNTNNVELSGDDAKFTIIIEAIAK